MSSHARLTAAGLLGLLAAHFAICLTTSGYSLWADEIASLKFAERPLSLLWSDWMVRETNPPLFYSLLHIWKNQIADSDSGIRILPVILGAFGIPLLFLAVRKVSTVYAALLAAALLTFSGQHIYYSQQLRGYGLAQTASIACIWAVISALDSATNRAWKWLILYVFACVIALYSHTTMILLPFLINIYVLPFIFFKRRNDISFAIQWVFANILILLCWTWWAFITIQQIIHPATISWIEPIGLVTGGRALVNAFVPSSNQIVRIILLAGATALILRMCRRHWNDHGIIFAILALGAPLLLALLSLKTPMFLARTLMWAQGPFIGALAIAIVEIEKRVLRQTIVLIALGFSFIGSVLAIRDAEREPWKRLVVDIQKRNPEAVVVAGERVVGFALRHYCQPAICRLKIYTVETKTVWERDFPISNLVDRKRLADISRENSSLYTVSRMGNDPSEVLSRYGRVQDLSVIEDLPENITLKRLTRFQP